MERALACALADAGCVVMNEVSCRKPLDESAFAKIRLAFAAEIPALGASGRV